MSFSPVENPTCEAFEEYGEVPETVLLNFMEDDVTWVTSKLSGAAGVMGAEVIELRNWIFCFRCASEELNIVVDRLPDWMANSSPPWVAYCALMACSIVVLDKSPGVHPVGIGETLRQALDKLVMRAAGDQAKTVCGKLQLCAGLEASIEGDKHAIGQRIIERLIARWCEVKESGAHNEEEESGGVAARLNNLIIEMTGTEEEAAEIFTEVQDMAVDDGRGDTVERE